MCSEHQGALALDGAFEASMKGAREVNLQGFRQEKHGLDFKKLARIIVIVLLFQNCYSHYHFYI